MLQKRRDEISLVITDANIPGEFDGFGLVQRIVRLGEECGVGVIMMSGDGDTVTKGVSLGSHDFMPKPIIKVLMLRKVEQLIQHRKSKLALQQERAEKEELQKEIDHLSEHLRGYEEELSLSPTNTPPFFFLTSSPLFQVWEEPPLLKRPFNTLPIR